jgi:septal ring factor EnvC (AmiA/AmiB activator)
MKELAARAAKLRRGMPALKRQLDRLEKKTIEFEVEHRKFRRKLRAFEKAYAKTHPRSGNF